MTPEQIASAFTAKRVGPNRWQAKCPAHEDRSPSLSIGERDGKTLVHCFGGCDVESVLGAVGLTVSDCFPDPDPIDRMFHHTPGKAWVSPKETLGILRHEALVLLVAAADVANGKPLDRERVITAFNRIRDAEERM